jgi:beta-glucanase (GH16 family)
MRGNKMNKKTFASKILSLTVALMLPATMTAYAKPTGNVVPAATDKAQTSKTDDSKQDHKLWTQIFSDEFDGKNGSAPSSKNWVHETGNNNGWGNNELEYYTDSTQNVFLRGGKLIIKALKDHTGKVTSGRIKTSGKFSMKYGRIDVKAKLPVGTGLWPAIWMMPQNDAYGGWAASGEIDIMENKGRLPGEVSGTLHYGGSWPNNKYSGATYTFPEGESAADFHTYSLEWEPGEIRWYVDGKFYQKQTSWYTRDKNGEQFAYPAPFDQEFYLILNLAFGGNFDGGKNDPSVLPGEMAVDYVRAYELTGRPYKTAVEPTFEKEPLPTGAKTPTADGNYIYNGDFKENNIQDNADGSKDFGTGWNFVHIPDTAGNGSVSIDNIDGTNYAKVNVTAPGTQDYAVQLIQTTTLGKGRWYKLSFDAKSDTNRKINTKVGGGASRGFSVYSPVYGMNLTDSFQHFEKTFQMQADSDLAARLEFELGLNTSTVWIGNVRLEETVAPEVDYNATKPPLPDGNRVYNGAFDKGTITRLDYWNLNTSSGAEASYKVPEDTRELNVDITSPGTSSDAITVDQRGVQLAKGSTCTLNFEARAEAARSIKVKVVSQDGKTVYSPEKTFNLTTKNSSQKLEFVMNNETDLNSQLIFELGGESSKVYLDNVSLKQTSVDYSNVVMYPLKNGDFSEGFKSWNPLGTIGDGGASTITNENGAAKIAVTTVGPNPWSIMLNQENMKFSKDVEYLVSFDARTTVDRNIEVILENAAYTRYFDKTAALGSEMKHFEYTFTMTKDDTLSLKFLLGNVPTPPTKVHDIFIDNVKCEVKDSNHITSVVKNGTFDGTEEPWKLWTGDGGSATTSLTADGALKIAVSNIGPNSWSVQEFQEGLKFENGQRYSLSFKAKADEERKMNINIGKALTASPWFTNYMPTKTVDLSDTMTEYNFEFTMNEPTYDNGKLVFEVGNVAGGNAVTNVYIDDVVLTKVASDNTGDPGDQDGALIKNGTFDSSTDNWGIWSHDNGSKLGVEEGKLKVTVVSEGPAFYSVQVIQNDLKLESGKTYKLSFDASSPIARNIQPIVEHNGGDYTKYLQPITSLSTEMEKYSYEFTMNTADANAHLVFALGKIEGNTPLPVPHDVFIDNVTLEEVVPTVNN